MDEIVTTQQTEESTNDTTSTLTGAPAPAGAAELEWGLEDLPDSTAVVAAAEPERFNLRHLGEEVEVTREEVIALAQKGRDYDRIRERLVRLESGAQPQSSAIVRDVHDFVSAYGNSVKPDTIPAEVWTDVRAGIPLVVAYQRYENRLLRGKLKTHGNRVRATTGAFSAGENGGDSSIESNWYSEV